MNNSIYNNAYGILGLSSSATQKDITKRFKEISKYLSIDTNQEYDYDFGVYNRLRNKDILQEAMQNISNNSKKIIHYFFRMNFDNPTQQKYLQEIEQSFDYETIFNIYNETEIRNFIFLKNIAIAETLLLLSNRNLTKLETQYKYCVTIWYEIFSNEKFMQNFKKLFLSDDELGIDERIFQGDRIKNELITELTTIFQDIAKLHNNNNILSIFINKFGISDLDIANDIYANIQKQLNILDNMNISEDGYFDEDERKTLHNAIDIIESELSKLKELGLYESEKSKALRDKIANIIRKHSVDLFNEFNDEEDVITSLHQLSMSLSSSAGLKNKLEEEFKIITNNYKNKKDNNIIKELNNIFKRLDEIIYENNNIPSLDLINNILPLFNQIKGRINDKEFHNFADAIAFRLRNYAVHIHNEKKDFETSIKLLSIAIDIAYSLNLIQKLTDEKSQINKNITRYYDNDVKMPNGCMWILGIIVIGFIAAISG